MGETLVGTIIFIRTHIIYLYCITLEDKAINSYSEKRVREGLALWQLLQLPPKQNALIAIMYQITQILRSFLHKFFPFLKNVIPLPTQTALSQTLIPFSTIVKQVKFYIIHRLLFFSL